jgi:hypothetical protein
MRSRKDLEPKCSAVPTGVHDLFEELGYAGASTLEIATRAKVPVCLVSDGVSGHGRILQKSDLKLMNLRKRIDEERKPNR